MPLPGVPEDRRPMPAPTSTRSTRSRFAPRTLTATTAILALATGLITPAHARVLAGDTHTDATTSTAKDDGGSENGKKNDDKNNGKTKNEKKNDDKKNDDKKNDGADANGEKNRDEPGNAADGRDNASEQGRTPKATPKPSASPSEQSSETPGDTENHGDMDDDHGNMDDDHGDMDDMHGDMHEPEPVELHSVVGPNLEHDHPFTDFAGTTPTNDDADSLRQVGNMVLNSDTKLREAWEMGLISGFGTVEAPYVIEQLHVAGSLILANTTKVVVIREVLVDNQLKLNYVGDLVHVHHVRATDLRVNENQVRTGLNTGGLWHDNAFAVVGQIRHFIGEFRENTVGPRPLTQLEQVKSDTGLEPVAPGRVFNFDGFHGADVHHNEFIGRVDIKLHGHNHGDCFTCGAHDHAASPEDMAAMHMHMHPEPSLEQQAAGMPTHHSVRYHSVRFADNLITVSGEVNALVFADNNHAGDDKTANSEPNDALNDNHQHYMDVTLENNVLNGGGIKIQNMVPEDEAHPLESTGVYRVVDNQITIPYNRNVEAGTISGFAMDRTDGARLVAAGNDIQFVAFSGIPAATANCLVLACDGPTRLGMVSSRSFTGEVTFLDNVVRDADVGVKVTSLEAARFDLLRNRLDAHTLLRLPQDRDELAIHVDYADTATGRFSYPTNAGAHQRELGRPTAD